MSETGCISTPMCVSRWYFQVKVICATPVIWVCGRDGIQVTSFLCNLMNCTCLLCGTQALGERVNDFDVLERDSGWFGAVSLFCAFAASCLFLQRCRHSTLTSCWKRLTGFGVSKRDSGWFGAVSLVHALAALVSVTLCLQWHTSCTLTSCWERLNGFGVSKRDLGWFGTVSLVHALAATVAHICVSSGMHITPWQAVRKRVNGLDVLGIWDGLGQCYCSVSWLPQGLMSVSPVAHTFHPEKLSELVWLCLQQYTFGDPHQPDCKDTPHHSRQWLAQSCTHFVVVFSPRLGCFCNTMHVLLPRVSTVALGMLCDAKYTHSRQTVKHH